MPLQIKIVFAGRKMRRSLIKDAKCFFYITAEGAYYQEGYFAYHLPIVWLKKCSNAHIGFITLCNNLGAA